MNAANVEIRPAAAEHLPALAELAAVIWREYYPGIISSAQIEYMLARMYAPEKLREEMQSHGIRFIRLLVNGAFSGFASFGPGEQRDEMKLHKCYLLPALHGNGYGSLLLQHSAREAAQLGARWLILTVNKANTRAITAYQRNGFFMMKSVVTDIGGGFVMDDFVMAKELTK